MKAKSQLCSYSKPLVREDAHAQDKAKQQQVRKLLIPMQPQSDAHADPHHAGHRLEERQGPLHQLFAVRVLEGLQILNH